MAPTGKKGKPVVVKSERSGAVKGKGKEKKKPIVTAAAGRKSTPRLIKQVENSKKAVDREKVARLKKKLQFDEYDYDSGKARNVLKKTKVKTTLPELKKRTRKRNLRDEDDSEYEVKKGKAKLEEDSEDLDVSPAVKCRSKKKARVDSVEDNFEATGGSISSRGNMIAVCDLIKAKLSPRNLTKFKSSCFGHLLDVPTIQFQGQLFFLLLNALDMSSSGSGNLIFRLNGSLVKFGELEFAAITGLKMKTADMLPSSSNFHSKVFGGEAKLFANNIKNKFIEECGGSDAKQEGDSEVCLQLAMHLVVYCIFTTRDGTSKRIQVNLMHLVDDMSSFNNYSWGKLAYDFFESQFFHTARTLSNKRGQDRPSADICGFAIPLQVWTYEVLPKFARNCASMKNAKTQFPRILRWTTTQFYQYSFIKAFFTAGEANSLRPFLLSADEKEKVRRLMPTDRDVARPTIERDDLKSVGKTSALEELIADDILAMREHINETLDGIKKKLNENLDLFEVVVMKSVRTCIESELNASTSTRTRNQGGDSEVEPEKEEDVVDEDGEEKAETEEEEDVDQEDDEQEGDEEDNEEEEQEEETGEENDEQEGEEEEQSQEENDEQEGDDGNDEVKEEENVEEEKDKQNDEEIVEQKEEETKQEERPEKKQEEKDEGSEGKNHEDAKIYQSPTSKMIRNICEDIQGDSRGKNLQESQTKPLSDDTIQQSTDTKKAEADFAEDVPIRDIMGEISGSEKRPPAKKKTIKKEPLSKKKVKKTVIKKESATEKSSNSKRKSVDFPILLERLMDNKYFVIREYNWAVVQEFYKWHTNSDKMATTPLPTQNITVASVEWFEPLYKATGWLTDSHCDVLINLVIIYSQRFPEDFLHNWAVVERQGTDCIMSDDVDRSLDKIAKYVDGTLPRQGGKGWKTVDKVYGVANINDDHWVLYMIDLLQQTMFVFDSLDGHRSDIECYFGHAKTNIPKILKALKVYENRLPAEELKDQWELHFVDGTPQQQNLADCGVMAIKCLECLVSGTPLSVINPRRATFYRNVFCIELFKWGKEVAK